MKIFLEMELKKDQDQRNITSSVFSLTKLKTGSSEKEHIKVLTKCLDGMTGFLLAIAALACSFPIQC